MDPRLAIELDDRSHQQADREERDAFVDEVFRAAGLPLVHIPAAKGYQVDEIRGDFSRSVANPLSGDSGPFKRELPRAAERLHQPLRDLDEVVQEIRDLESETEGLLEQILDFGMRAEVETGQTPQ